MMFNELPTYAVASFELPHHRAPLLRDWFVELYAGRITAAQMITIINEEIVRVAYGP